MQSLRLFLFYTLFLTYSCAVPFNFGITVPEILDNIGEIRWIPYFINGRRESLMDIASNLLLFVPFGFFLAGYFISRIKTSGTLVICFMTGAFVSCLQETIQLFSIDRISSVTDIFNNSIGSVFGASTAILYHKKIECIVKPFLIRQLKKPLLEINVYILFLSVLFLGIIPMDISIDVSYLKSAVKYFIYHTEIVPEKWVMIQSSINNFMMFLFAGGLLFATYRKKRNSFVRGFYSLVVSVAYIVLIEFVQLFIVSRSSSVSNIFFGFLGVLSGISLGLCFFRNGFSYGKFKKILLPVYLVYLSFNNLFPFILTENISDNFSVYSLIPFSAYFVTISVSSLSDLLSQVFIFMPAGVILIKNKGYLKTFFLGTVLGCLFEIPQIFISTRFFDVTDILSVGIGCVLGRYLMIKFQSFRRTI